MASTMSVVDVLWERLLSPIVVGPLAALLVWNAYRAFTAKSPVPPELPWVGKDSEGSIAEVIASFKSFGNARNWLKEGYEKYQKKSKSYVFPDFSGIPEVIVPPSQIKWLLDQPDEVLSVSELHFDTLEGDYAFTDSRILRPPFHEHVVHRNLARKLGPKLMEVWDEVQQSIDDTWGKNTTQFKDICVFTNLMGVIARISNRLFVGLPLCRNKHYLDNMAKFAQDVFGTGMWLRFVPQRLKFIIGPLVAIPNNYHYRQTAKITIPYIKERLANIERKNRDPSFQWEEPNDYVSWHIRQAQDENNQEELDPVMISRRLMPLNFAAIHTTVFTLNNVLFDLIGADPSRGFLDGIREEVTRVFREENGVWTKAGLQRLVRTDSAIRESMRVNTFLTRALGRKVLDPEGITNKAEGWWVPRNARISVDAWSVQHDPDLFPNPYDYDAFRFSRPREEAEAKAEEERDPAEILKGKNLGMISTSNSFLPFGHGRHACPGRFFVSHEMKMFLAHMLMNYDIEPLAERPQNTWFGPTVLPPMKEAIRVRRKVRSTAA